MAEENPHIEIKIPSKPINNSREKYLSENEKLILGRHGFIFKSYPPLKEKYKDNERYNHNVSSKLQHNNSLGKIETRNRNNNCQMYKSQSQSNILLQPILRFRDRTDLERICDTIQQYVPPNEQESLKEIRSRHVHSIDFSKGNTHKCFLKNINNLKDNLNSSALNVRNKNYNFLNENHKNNNYNNKNKQKLYFTRLQRLNADAKKIRGNLHFKTHFKGVESVFINPKQIYDIQKKDDIFVRQKIENYAFNDKIEKDIIERRNEYKKDINELLSEEKQKQSIINSKEFSNYLNNKQFYNYKDMDNNNNLNEKNEGEKNKKIRDIDYLRNLAFKDSFKNSGINTFNEIIEENTENSLNDLPRKNNEKEAFFENEHQLKIGGKIYHMKTQMDQIAREILNKCNFYSVKK